MLRGLKTLGVRVQRHVETAGALAQELVGRPGVKRVLYPGLETHPGHAVARAQMRGFGGMVGLELEGGLPASRAFLEALRIFALAESLGGVESLAEHPAIMTHASIPKAAREASGIGDGLVRLSVGLESAADLRADLERGLDAARRAR